MWRKHASATTKPTRGCLLRLYGGNDWLPFSNIIHFSVEGKNTFQFMWISSSNVHQEFPYLSINGCSCKPSILFTPKDVPVRKCHPDRFPKNIIFLKKKNPHRTTNFQGKFRDTSLLLQKVISVYSSYIKLQAFTILCVRKYKNPRTVFSPKWFSSVRRLSCNSMTQ